MITLHDGKKILAPLAGGLSGMNLDDGSNLVAKVGTLADAKNVTIRLYVKRNTLFKHEVLIDRALDSSEYSYQAIDEETGYIRINFDKIVSGYQSGKKHDITLSLSVGLPEGNVIDGGMATNRDLTQQASITVK